MSLFGQKLQSQNTSQQLQNVQLDKLMQLQAAAMQHAQQAMMGNAGFQNVSFGPAGMLTKSGLGPIKVNLLPEETCVEAIIGWRRWSVTMFGETLLSNNGVPWEPCKALAAVCALGNACQGIHCGCGIYAYKLQKDAQTGENAPTAVTHIWGQVALWGRVIEHKTGYRAQFAYPKALMDTGGIARRMSELYGIPLLKEAQYDEGSGTHPPA